MAFLVAELTKSEMWAIYLMGFEKEMPDQVTKADLVRIIRVLCKKLNWIEADPVEVVTQKSGNDITVRSTISEQTNNNSPEREPLRENSRIGSDTENNDPESDRNVCANQEKSQEINSSEIITTAAIASNDQTDMDTSVLNQQPWNI